MFIIEGKYTKANVMIDNLEESCISQITSFVNHPSFIYPISIMPDAHSGKGSCIGFTMEMGPNIIPNVIGVDIGCGMLSFNIGKQLPASLEIIDRKIRDKIPMGMDVHDKGIIHFKDNFPWKDVQSIAHKFTLAYGERGFTRTHRCEDIANVPTYNMSWFEEKCDMIGAGSRRVIDSIGTLGGGK